MLAFLLYELVLIVLYGILDAVYTVRGRTSRPGRRTLAILSIQDDVPPAVLLRGWQSTPRYTLAYSLRGNAHPTGRRGDVHRVLHVVHDVYPPMYRTEYRA